MRCKICDWSPSLPGSIFRGSLDENPFKGPQGARGWDPVTETYQCTKCTREDTVEAPMTIGDLFK